MLFAARNSRGVDIACSINKHRCGVCRFFYSIECVHEPFARINKLDVIARDLSGRVTGATLQL